MCHHSAYYCAVWKNVVLCQRYVICHRQIINGCGNFSLTERRWSAAELTSLELWRIHFFFFFRFYLYIYIYSWFRWFFWTSRCPWWPWRRCLSTCVMQNKDARMNPYILGLGYKLEPVRHHFPFTYLVDCGWSLIFFSLSLFSPTMNCLMYYLR